MWCDSLTADSGTYQRQRAFIPILVLALSISTIRAELNYTALTKFPRYSGTHLAAFVTMAVAASYSPEEFDVNILRYNLGL